MKRMITIKDINSLINNSCIAIPTEENKIYCQQFVADELILSNVEAGLYLVKLTQTDGDHIVYSSFMFDFKYESTYGAIYSPFFYDINTDTIIALKGDYSGNSKTMTLTLLNTQGTTIQSPTSFHVDIYKLNRREE